MYQLDFNDAKMQKLAPSKLQVGTYTTDTVKMVGSCTFYIVHPNKKKLIEVTFYVAMNNGSVLLSCKNHLTTWLNTIKAKIGLHPIKNKSYYQLSRSPQENKSSITYTETRSAHSNNKARSAHSNTTCQETGTQS